MSDQRHHRFAAVMADQGYAVGLIADGRWYLEDQREGAPLVLPLWNTAADALAYGQSLGLESLATRPLPVGDFLSEWALDLVEDGVVLALDPDRTRGELAFCRAEAFAATLTEILKHDC